MARGKKLNLPMLTGVLPAAKCLSMDDYVKFVALNLKYTIDKRVTRKQKKLAAVNVAFSLK
jgi:hypothetical protein